VTDHAALAERIHGILVRAGIGFTPSKDGLEFFVPIRDGTAAVMVRPEEFGDEPVVFLHSPILQGVPFEEAGARALAAVNLRNCGLIFGRLCYYEEEGVIAYEYAILAGQLQSEEFLRALQIIAAHADTLDDDLRAELGTGRTARDVWGRPEDAGAA
jgi:Putative bacterial sensory transduction regulator